MYSKVYRVTCSPGQGDALMAHYDSAITPAIRESEKHAGHHMIQTNDTKWLLVSNYISKDAAESAVPMVQDLVKPMIEQYGMDLEVITEGEVTRSY